MLPGRPSPCSPPAPLSPEEHKKASWGRKLANVAQHVVSYQEQGGDDARCTNLYSEVPPYSLAGRKKLFALKGRGRSGVIALRSGMKMCAL